MVSVVIPVYNSEDYLEECIKSVLGQTYRDLEIILIDDGSSDRSAAVCEEFSKIDNRVIVFHKKNGGPGAARNLGIKFASGEYIGFVDSDDTVDIDMYREMVEAGNKYNSNMVMCPYRIITNEVTDIIRPSLPSNSIINSKTIRTIVLPEIIGKGRYGFASLCNKIYRKQFLKDNHLLIDESRYHGEDWWFNIQSFERLDKFIIVSDPLYNYVQQNSSSLMKKYDVNKFDIYIKGYQQCKVIAEKYNLDLTESYKNLLLQAYTYMNGVVSYEENALSRVKKVIESPEVIESYYKAKRKVGRNVRLLFILGFRFGPSSSVAILRFLKFLKK